MGLIHALLIGLVTLLPAAVTAPARVPAAPAPAVASAQIGWCSHEDGGGRSVECTLADQDGSWTCTCSSGGRVTSTCTQPGGVSVNACEFRSCCE